VRQAGIVSGIVGIVNLDGALVDRHLLEQMTRALAFRGPDAQQVWSDGAAGFGHALLRTTFESETERQPWTLDRLSITADARIDARAELLATLADQGHPDLDDRPDAELILHAYRVWGESCVDHLLGDFAFAIWDADRQRLFCARDHIGLKPFFYARVGTHLVVGNTLTCIRRHPAVSNRLNDEAIADFLVAGYLQDIDTTSFADIQRLPPAHVLVAGGDGVQIRRYWTFPIDAPIRYRRPHDYVERFQELMGAAVGDRLRTKRAGIFMSGGVDSTSVASAVSNLRAQKACDVHAFTVVFDRLIPDEERKYAGIAAEALSMPIHFLAADAYALYDHWDDPALCAPEPAHEPWAALNRDQTQQVADHSRVALTGVGADPLFGYHIDAAGMLKRGQVWRLAADIATCLAVHRRRPPVGVRTTIRALMRRQAPPKSLPPWMNPDLVARLGLAERYRQSASTSPEPLHPVRGNAQRALLAPKWALAFESQDPGVIGVPLETRHPFFDLRLVRYLLAIPPVPWAMNKEMLRTAMLGRMPDAIRHRPKTPLLGEPVLAQCRDAATRVRLASLVTRPNQTYVSPDAFPPRVSESMTDVWTNLRPISLEYWFRWASVA
jgi:asparagine synthase (glutamine-hydrolysing)